jgi:hypothetical protein
VPLFVKPVLGAFGGQGAAAEHARQAHRVVGDVDHLLDFAVALGLDLADLERDQAAERVLVLAQGLGDQAHRFAPTRGGQGAPGSPGNPGAADDLLVVLLIGSSHAGNVTTGGRVQ